MDRMGEVAYMLDRAFDLRNSAKSSEEKRYYDQEIYRWKREMLDNNINPSSRDSFEFQMAHVHTNVNF